MADRARSATEAAAALNLTALVASDIGAHDLARDMCWRQFSVLAEHTPLGAEHAALAMEPIINLARLATRQDDGDRAHRLLDQALTAAHEPARIAIDGRAVDFTTLAADAAGCHAMKEKLWIAFLSDGARALTRAGRWAEAQQAAERRNGIGIRLLDGRQTAIIASLAAGKREDTEALLADTEVIDPWERALLTYLELCASPASDLDIEARYERLIDQITALELPIEQQLFQIRLGVSALEVAASDHRDAAKLATTLAQTALRTADAYAARDLLASDAFRVAVDPATAAHLTTTMLRSGLEPGTDPSPPRTGNHDSDGPRLTGRLRAIMDDAVTSLARTLVLG
ncbi:hypothetical protein [Glycomyces sp. MUSA5-2]|uniref:hypothetical protein n=1 Tax=Glycomyces sp. MUSA5-2 TaxID=2053002 RepID=UPI00300829F8